MASKGAAAGGARASRPARGERRGMGASEATEMRAIDMHLFLRASLLLAGEDFAADAARSLSFWPFVHPEHFSRQLAGP